MFSSLTKLRHYEKVYIIVQNVCGRKLRFEHHAQLFWASFLEHKSSHLKILMKCHLSFSGWRRVRDFDTFNIWII